MARYAESTTVPPDRSRAEIEKTLTRYGANGFLYGWQEKQAVVGFQMNGRQVRFLLPLPDHADLSETPTGRARAARQIEEAYDKAVRQKWRALALVIKAKLEAIESEISTFDEEFLAWVVLPDGATVGQAMLPQLADAYATGEMPPLLGDGGRGRKSR